MDEKYCVLCKQLQGNCAWFCLSCLRRLEKTSPYPYPQILWDGLDNLKDWTLTENTVREYEKSTNIRYVEISNKMMSVDELYEPLRKLTNML